MIISILSLLAFPPLHAQEVITLDLHTAVEQGEYILDGQGKWDRTYDSFTNELSFNEGMFRFSHIIGQNGGTDVGGGMSYWDGFTICNSGDTEDYGVRGNSDGWVSNQWGCMAGGGLDDSFNAVNGQPYLVAYWGYYFEQEGMHSCQVLFDDTSHRVKGTYICNHPWPYYGNIHSDGFASAFVDKGSRFSVTAHGLLNGEDTGSQVTMTLAENNGDGISHHVGWPKGLIQSADWQWMDLEALGKVDGVYFTMQSTDEDPLYGPNTAVYFCLDKMQVYEHSESMVPSRPSGLAVKEAREKAIVLSWRAQAEAVTYDVYLNGAKVASTRNTSYTFLGLSPYTDYTLGIVARNESGESDMASIEAKTVDITAPLTPRNLKVNVQDCYNAELTWNASTDNVGVTRYIVTLNGKVEARPKNPSYKLTGLDPRTSYIVEVQAMDASGNVSAKVTTTFITPAKTGTIDGDVNGDGRLDLKDVGTLADILSGKVATHSLLGDIDGDNKITVSDMVRLIGLLRQ